MDAGTRILTLLSEAVVDALTPGQIAEGTGLSISSVNVHLAKLLERKYVYFSGAVATSGRYAKQFSISPDGLALVASGHTDLILTNADNARVAEQMLEYFKSVMEEITEQFIACMETSETELNKSIEQLRGMTAETVALAKQAATIVAIPPVPEVSPAKVKTDKEIYKLKRYVEGADITPLVDLLTSARTYKKWIELRKEEYGYEKSTDFTSDEASKANEIARAAMAKHGWEL